MCKDLDEITTFEEICEALQKEGGIQNVGKANVKSIRKTLSGTQIAFLCLCAVSLEFDLPLVFGDGEGTRKMRITVKLKEHSCLLTKRTIFSGFGNHLDYRHNRQGSSVVMQSTAFYVLLQRSTYWFNMGKYMWYMFCNRLIIYIYI